MSKQSMDEEAMLALNQAHSVETSALTPVEMQALLAQAFHVGLHEGGRGAFLIALDQDSLSASPNFQWFKTRYRRFVYVDRVIVAPPQRGRGVARGLYEELFAMASHTGHVFVGCEVNVEPPNPGSDAFHEALGFAEVGRAALLESQKFVRYLLKSL
jgi:uncharacterized protein